MATNEQQCPNCGQQVSLKSIPDAACTMSESFDIECEHCHMKLVAQKVSYWVLEFDE